MTERTRAARAGISKKTEDIQRQSVQPGTSANPLEIPDDVSRAVYRFPSSSAVTPPRFMVDLSLPPEKRYGHIYPVFAEHMAGLPALYDELLLDIFTPRQAEVVRKLTRFVLRRVYDREETRELRGLSKITGLPMYLLVAFNVLLDLFMGCTSGGVRVRNATYHPSDDKVDKSKMLHFRALDWGMDPLRKLVMHVDFVRKQGGPTIATSVTYFGYVGVLTGVKPGLSLSLNFRPHHDTSTRSKRYGYVLHLLLVLLGFRRSISSVLRGYLLPHTGQANDLASVLEDLQYQKSTAAYLIFSNGTDTASMEKDNGSATFERSSEFIVTLNHDVADEAEPEATREAVAAEPATMDATGMTELVGFSVERKLCVTDLLDRAKEVHQTNGFPEMPLEEEEVVGWMEGGEIVNEQTHYACIMDPTAGEVVWAQRWLEPFDTEKHRRRLEKAQRARESNAKRQLRAAYRTAERDGYSII